MTAYHYTIADRLVKILIDGQINVMADHGKSFEEEVRLCWLTVNPCWDATAFYGYGLDVLNNAGRIRITVEGDFNTHYAFQDRIDSLDGLESSARSVGVDPDDWRVSATPIPVSMITAIELWRYNRWVSFPFKGTI